ncbi:hypothetical protein DFH06DRAFT_218907 [Mycena polygramma]|nr:hypothetical protein DFH06DRAFT_218907 [Mycena polygramma]
MDRVATVMGGLPMRASLGLSPSQTVDTQPTARYFKNWFAMDARQPQASRKPTAEEIACREADRSEIAELDAQILAAENSLGLLRDKRNLLNERLDDYTYPVLTLPAEIVAEIFHCFLPVYPLCPPTCGILAPTTLGQICHEWREIALSTPSLWRAISLYLDFDRRKGSDKESLKNMFCILETWLERSCSCPLAIRFEVIQKEDTHSLKIEPFLQAIVSHSTRWEYLKISLPQMHNPRFNTSCSAPLLRDLGIGEGGMCWAPMCWAPSVEAPNLRQLVVTAQFHDTFVPLLPWNQLTALHLASVSPPQFMGILHHTANLVHCRLTIFMTPTAESDAARIDPRPLTLPRLEVLVMTMDGSLSHDEGPTGWFGLATFPALRRLQVARRLLEPDPIATLRAFIARSGCRLQEVYIPYADELVGACRTALPTIPFLSARDNHLGNRFFNHGSSVLHSGYFTDSEDDAGSLSGGEGSVVSDDYEELDAMQ